MSPDTMSTASINSLPVEILLMIFCYVGRISLYEDQEPQVPLGMIILHVSQTWRVIALSTPVIWSYISITNARRLHHLKLSLESVGDQAELEIFIHLGIGGQPINRALRMLLPHASRWRTLTLRLINKFTMEWSPIFASFMELDVPRLRLLEIMGARGFLSSREMGTFFPRGSISSLTSLRLERCDVPSSRLFSQLRRLTLRRVLNPAGYHAVGQIAQTPLTFSQIFSAAPQLRHLSVECVTSHVVAVKQPNSVAPPEQNSHEIHAPLLESLDIVLSNWVDDITAFGYLNLPSLRKLSFHVQHCSQAWTYFESLIHTFFTRFAHIEELRITMTATQLPRELMTPEFYHSFPRLKTLVLEGAHDSCVACFLKPWVEPEGSSHSRTNVPWPSLQMLVVVAPFDGVYYTYQRKVYGGSLKEMMAIIQDSREAIVGDGKFEMRHEIFADKYGPGLNID